MHSLKSLFHLIVLVSALAIVGELGGIVWECLVGGDHWRITLKFAAYTVLAAMGTAALVENLLVHTAGSTAVKDAKSRAAIRAELMEEIRANERKVVMAQAFADGAAQSRRANAKQPE